MIDDARASYPDAVAALCDMGWPQSCRDASGWPDFRALGLTDDHIPDLIRMAEDPVLNNSPQDSDEVWAPFHVCRALGQFRVLEAVDPMLRLLEAYPSDDHMHEELPYLMAAIGPEAIPKIADYIADDGIEGAAHIVAIECLEQIAKEHPASRDDCVARLVSQLKNCAANDEAVNGFLIASLTELRAKEAIETIRAAFAADAVDLTVASDLEDIEIEMGFRLFRETPRPDLRWHRNFGLADPDDGLCGQPAAGGTTNPFRHVGRNDSCPCGSGKKFKKCCLERA